jgi:hypothetical protein
VPVVQQARAGLLDTVIRAVSTTARVERGAPGGFAEVVMRRRPVPDEPRADRAEQPVRFRCDRAVAPPTPWAAPLPGQEIQLAPAVLAKRHPVTLYGHGQRRRPAVFAASVRW